MKFPLLTFFILPLILCSLNAQRPISQIEGRLEVFDNIDTTSIYVGLRAGKETTGGLNNSFFGTQSGESNISGAANSFFGYHSGHSNNANYNSFYGSLSGRANTSGYRNSFYGYQSGLSNEGGDENTFIGVSAGLSNESGNFNTFLGNASGLDNLSGSYNTFIGYKAGEENGNGNKNIAIGGNAGPTTSNSGSSNRLYIDVQKSDDPLIYGEFINDLVRINGDFDVTGSITGDITFDGTSINLTNLGVNDSAGLTWAESNDPVFGLIYDGEGTDVNNRMHLREYIGTNTNMMTFKANGNVGINKEEPLARLHIDGGSDATVTDGGYVLIGDKSDLNTIIDDNEIMARDNNETAPLNLNINGGDVRLGGKIRIKDDTTPAETGQMRFNSSTSDFEGYDGSKWISLSNKKEQKIFLGPGSFYSDDENETQGLGFKADIGVTINDGYGSFSKNRIIPVNLPVGSTITQIAYFFKEDLPDMSLEMKLVKYDLSTGGFTAGFRYESDFNNTPIGWTSANEVGNITIEDFNFYVIYFHSTGTGLSNHRDLLQYKGVSITYTLP